MPPGEPFRVGVSGAVRDHFRSLYRQAAEADLRIPFLKAGREIERRLTDDPLDFGEPLYTLRSTDIQVRIGSLGILAVEFGVREIDRIVWIRRFFLLDRG